MITLTHGNALAFTRRAEEMHQTAQAIHTNGPIYQTLEIVEYFH